MTDAAARVVQYLEEFDVENGTLSVLRRNVTPPTPGIEYHWDGQHFRPAS